MYISVVLNLEYMDIASRSKWYLKNLLHCKENGWALITHEYLKNNFRQIQEEITERLFNDFEMRPFTSEEIADVEQYYIPDSLFKEIDERYNSRTEVLEAFSAESMPSIENFLCQVIEEVRQKHSGEKIDGVFNCLEVPKFLRNVCDKFNLTIIPYVFSAIRKPHGYTQTLYYCNMDSNLYCSDECRLRYNSFLNEDGEVPMFSNKELIAIFGKQRTLPLLSLMDCEPPYEIAICGECFRLLPHTFRYSHYTDDDIHYECDQLFEKKKIRNRQHALLMDQIGVSRDEVRNDPAAFILSCKRVSAVASQIILKAMLWNRAPIMKRDTLPFSFACSKDYKSADRVDIRFLNFFIFSYLIPSGLMFDKDYWEWRNTRPTEKELYNKHLTYYANQMQIDFDKLSVESPEHRLKLLLWNRDTDESVIESIFTQHPKCDFNYDLATSRFEITGRSDRHKNIWILNSFNNDTVTSEFKVNVLDGMEKLKFYALDDLSGWVIFKRAWVSSDKNGETILKLPKGAVYFSKYSGVNLDFDLRDHTYEKIVVKVEWEYMNKDTYAKNFALK